MKAILNVSKFNQYSKYNGYSFEVRELLSSLVSLDVNGVKTDFSHKEVIIIDLQSEYQNAFDDFNWSSTTCDKYRNLNKYMDNNKIKYPVVETKTYA